MGGSVSYINRIEDRRSGGGLIQTHCGKGGLREWGGWHLWAPPGRLSLPRLRPVIAIDRQCGEVRSSKSIVVGGRCVHFSTVCAAPRPDARYVWIPPKKVWEGDRPKA